MVSGRSACTTLTSKWISAAMVGDVLTSTQGRNWPSYGDGFGSHRK